MAHRILRRRSIRLPSRDYSAPGAYFVTICTRDRECCLGQIVGGTTIPTPIGRMVTAQWFETARLREAIELRADEFILMPNHVHGIVRMHVREGGTRATLGDVVRSFKVGTTRSAGLDGGAVGRVSLWQRNYFERILRDEAEAARVRRYMAANPTRWAADQEARHRP